MTIFATIESLHEMKKSAVIILLTLLCQALPARVTDTLRVLSVGNSFSLDATEQNLHEIALADGMTMIIGNMYIAGCYLEKHWLNMQSDSAAYEYRKVEADGTLVKHKEWPMSRCFADEPWDAVVFSQASGLSGLIDSYEPYLTDLLKYARSRTQKGCRMMMHQTWAYASGSANSAFESYDFSQEKMYGALCEAYRSEAKKHKMGIIPCGTAVQNSRMSFNQDNVTRDGYHMHWWFGRYMTACTFYEVLTGNSVLDNAYVPSNLTEDRILLARKCAHAACQAPFEVTDVDWKPKYIGWYFDSLEQVPDVRKYTLPDALTMGDGRKVESAEQWYSERRPELLGLFETEMFGKAPGAVEGTTWEVVEEDRHALGGKAVRKQVKVDFHRLGRHVTVLMYLPTDAAGKVPVFMGLNFDGNVTVCDDPAIIAPTPKEIKSYGVYPAVQRGSQASRWPVEEIISRGYGIATFHVSDIDPDFDDGFRNGVTPYIYREGQTYPEPDQWGTISAWAWGLSRVMDYLETDPDIDAGHVAVIGHSRLGKTALLAGARDERFAMAISNCSGCCGAALSRRNVGETVESITHLFPHWFCGNFFKYADDIDSLPFDQHELLALMAPRPVYVTSAEQDRWADPVGERLALQEAQRVYDFLGLERGLTGYHIHEGGHGISLVDWEHYLDFADRYLR